MARFQYVGETQRVYPDIIIPGVGSLVANPGDIVELDKLPGRFYWVELTKPATSPVVSSPSTATPAAPTTEV